MVSVDKMKSNKQEKPVKSKKAAGVADKKESVNLDKPSTLNPSSSANNKPKDKIKDDFTSTKKEAQTSAVNISLKANTNKADKLGQQNKDKKFIKIRQVVSGCGKGSKSIGTLIGLGLNKVNKTSTLIDTPAVRGMINKVNHLIEVLD